MFPIDPMMAARLADRPAPPLGNWTDGSTNRWEDTTSEDRADDGEDEEDEEAPAALRTAPLGRVQDGRPHRCGRDHQRRDPVAWTAVAAAGGRRRPASDSTLAAS